MFVLSSNDSEADLAEKLFEAVVSGNMPEIVRLKAVGGDVNSVNMLDNNRSLLHFSVLKGRAEVCILFDGCGRSVRCHFRLCGR